MLPNDIELYDGEKPIYFTRKHWVIFREPFVFAFFFPFAFVMLSFIVSSPTLENIDKKIIGSLAISSLLLYLSLPVFIFGLVQSIWRFFIWSKTIYVVTNKRVIVVDQINPLNHEIHQTTLDKIQDVVCEVKGIQAMIYGYGDIDVRISTPDDSGIRFYRIGHPKKAQKVIMELLSGK